MSGFSEPLERRVLLASAHLAAISDYGYSGEAELAVANLVKSWDTPTQPLDAIFTCGDNDQFRCTPDTIDVNIGQYYHEYIFNYQGTYGAGSPTRRFYPAPGNHDWGNSVNPRGLDTYLAYFDLPGNERYYDVVIGPVHLFAIDSDVNEPDGNTSTSVQAQWLQSQLAASTAPWNIVYFHHAPYSSIGSVANMRWPFREWGADAVFSGHFHTYERLNIGGLTYFVIGTGGAPLSGIGTPIAGSQFRCSEYGAMRIDADDAHITFQFINRNGVVRDTYTMSLPVVTIAAADASAAEMGSDPGTFVVTRTGDTVNELRVRYALSGSATPGVDYPALSGTVVIPAGASSASFSLVPIDDDLAEGEEYAVCTLLSDPAYVVGGGPATIAIADHNKSPMAPGNLRATPVSLTRINLTWADNSTTEKGFRIEISTDGQDFTTLGTVGANVTAYSASGLRAGVLYYFRVLAVDDVWGDSASSNIVSAKTGKLPASPYL